MKRQLPEGARVKFHHERVYDDVSVTQPQGDEIAELTGVHL